jgi:murein hydrolase activator
MDGRFNLVTGQNVDNLRSERESLLKEIESTNSLIVSKKSSREAAFQQVNALNKKISIRNRVD